MPDERKVPLLDYHAPPESAVWNVRRLLAFVTLTTLIGVGYWARADWYAYIQNPSGQYVPKFELPLAVQVTVSLGVGALGSVILTVLWHGVVLAVRKLRPEPSHRRGIGDV